MNYFNYLPYNVIENPSIGCLDVVPVTYPKFIIRITDNLGKAWYLRTIGRDRYDWTRSQCFARMLSIDVAKKHAEQIAAIWKARIEETEST